ncbi:MAG: heavy metal-associated domain-containing protein [Hyphomonadaceae bacterium]
MIRYLLLSTGLMLATSPVFADTVQHDLRVDGMTCPFCVATSERALEKLDGVEAVATDLEEGVIHVCTDDSVSFTDEELKDLFLEKGFTYRSQTTTETCSIDDGNTSDDG